MPILKVLLVAVASSCVALATWGVASAVGTPGRSVELLPAAAMGASCDVVATKSDVQALRAQLDTLSRYVEALGKTLQPIRLEPVAAALSEAAPPAPTPAPIVAIPTPAPLQRAPPPLAAVASPAPPFTPNDVVMAESSARAQHTAELAASVDALTQVQLSLATGEASGAKALIDAAAQTLGGASALELHSALEALDNDDLSRARGHIELAILRAQR